MKELSLNILDIAQNSIRAEATLIEILLDETETSLKLTIKDNGYGMSEDFLKTVVDPFSTTRTTRKVGMGIPLLKLAEGRTIVVCSDAHRLWEIGEAGGTLELDTDETEPEAVRHALFTKLREGKL